MYNTAMEVYVEDIIAENFIMTYMISTLSYVATKREQSKKRKIYGAIFSTIITLAYPFIKNAYVLYAVKCFVFIILSIVLYLKKQKILLSALTLLAITFCVAGGITVFDGLVKNNVAQNAQKVTIVGFIIVSMLRLLLVRIAHFSTYSQFYNNIILQIRGIKRNVIAYTDTGNTLVDEKTGLSVVVVTLKALSPYIKSEAVSVLKNERYLFYSSVDGVKRKLFLIDECKVYFNGKVSDVVVGVVSSKLATDVDVIIGPNLT